LGSNQTVQSKAANPTLSAGLISFLKQYVQANSTNLRSYLEKFYWPWLAGFYSSWALLRNRLRCEWRRETQYGIRDGVPCHGVPDELGEARRVYFFRIHTESQANVYRTVLELHLSVSNMINKDGMIW